MVGWTVEWDRVGEWEGPGGAEMAYLWECSLGEDTAKEVSKTGDGRNGGRGGDDLHQ